MQHYIIVKFKDKTAVDADRITEIFSAASSITGVQGAKVHWNCIDRDNRWDMMIEIEMKKEALPVYDASKMHHDWKEEFTDCIEKKAIFDCED